MFVPSRYRAAVTPRTPLEKSYSGRIVSRSTARGFLLALPFFIVLALAFGGESGADDSCSWWSLHEGYYKESTLGGHSQHKITLFRDGVVWVRQENGERIGEGRDGLIKGDPVLAKVRRGLVSIPFELVGHEPECTRSRAPRRMRLTDRA